MIINKLFKLLCLVVILSFTSVCNIDINSEEKKDEEILLEFSCIKTDTVFKLLCSVLNNSDNDIFTFDIGININAILITKPDSTFLTKEYGPIATTYLYKPPVKISPGETKKWEYDINEIIDRFDLEGEYKINWIFGDIKAKNEIILYKDENGEFSVIQE